jgi:hypothetical protein
MTQETIVQMTFFSEFWQVLGFALLLAMLLVVLWRMGRNAKAAAHEQALLRSALAQLTERVDVLATQSTAGSEHAAVASLAVSAQPAESSGVEGLDGGFRFAAEEPAGVAEGPGMAAEETETEAVVGFSFAPEVVGTVTSEESGEESIDFGAVQSRVSAWDAKPSESEEPALEEPALEEPALEEPALEEPALEEPALEEPALEEPALEEPALEEPALEEPALEEPALEEPALEEPALEEPALEEPALEEPALEEPALEEPALEEPALEEPALEEPVAAESKEERQPESAPSSAQSLEVASQPEAPAVLLPLPAPPERPDVAMVRCGRCGRKIAYPKRLSGKPIRCPACQTGYTLP